MDRRHILDFNITRHPSAEWVVQQLREAFPEAGPYRYAILDHDSIFNGEVIGFLEATGLQVKRTSVQAPWQNGTAERWIRSCREEILDHVIALNEEHLRRLVASTSAITRRTGFTMRWTRTPRMVGQWSQSRRPMPR